MYVSVVSRKIRSITMIAEKMIRTESPPNFIYSNEEIGKYR